MIRSFLLAAGAAILMSGCVVRNANGPCGFIGPNGSYIPCSPGGMPYGPWSLTVKRSSQYQAPDYQPPQYQRSQYPKQRYQHRWNPRNQPFQR